MIRRRLAPDPPQTPSEPGAVRYLALITQDDHARLAGELARHLTGTSRFRRPEPFDPFVTAVASHDAGWPLHDDPRLGFGPKLNPEGLPLDVFESTREVALAVWPGACDAAAKAGPWAELLCSLHVLALSAYATSPTGFNVEKIELDTLPARFEMNKFQHREIERQERLRRTLGLSIELPLTLGLADENVDPREDHLRCHLRWLQAMDLISLAVCCTEPPQDRTQDVHPEPGATGEPLRLRREPGTTRSAPGVIVVDDLVVTPWPFAVESIPLRIPAVRVPMRRYTAESDLRAEMAAAPTVTLASVVRAR